MRVAIGLFAALLSAAPSIAASVAETPQARLKADVAWLADDARAGREAGTRGHMEAAAYVARQFKSLRLEPGAGGDWFQTVPLREGRRDLGAARLELIGGDARRERLVHLQDYIVGRTLSAKRFTVEGPAVFVGHGVVDAATGHDDYEGIDARGKIAVVFGGAPAHFDSEKRAYLGSGDAKRRSAAAHGAIAMVVLPTARDMAQGRWAIALSAATRSGATWIDPAGAPHVVAAEAEPSAYMNVLGARRLFAGAAVAFDALQAREEQNEPLKAFDLPRRIALSGATRFKSTQSPNVVAVIEGTDAALRDEALVLIAHLDHLGVKKSAAARGEDRVYNGALDNAIGVAMLIETARRFKASAPRRTIVFLASTAEEKGLLGAEYFARFPAVGGRTIVAAINLDMPLMLYPFTDVIAFGAERSTLAPHVRSAAEAIGVAVSADPFPEEGIFTRSDHYPLVEQGVPALFLFTGMANGGGETFKSFRKTHYHRPSDDLALPIDYDAAARFAALNYEIARRVADSDERPRWNDGDFFGEMFGASGKAGRANPISDF